MVAVSPYVIAINRSAVGALWNGGIIFARDQRLVARHAAALWNAPQATTHYLNQWWLVYWRIYTLLGLNELMVYDWETSGETALRWCRLATRHYLSQWSPRSLTPCGFCRPQRVKGYSARSVSSSGECDQLPFREPHRIIAGHKSLPPHATAMNSMKSTKLLVQSGARTVSYVYCRVYWKVNLAVKPLI